MTKRLKLITSAFFVALSLMMLTAKPARASEGTAQLTSASGQNSRCFVSSVLMQNRSYKVVVSCRDLIYPPSKDLFSYMLWASPAEGGNPIKLGELGIGKAEFNTNKAFTDLSVTSEADNRARSPSERVIMNGTIQPFTIEGEVQPAQTKPEEKQEPAEDFGEIIEEPTPTPTPTLQRSSIFGGIKRAGIIAIVLIFVIIIIIAAITRSRG